MAITTRQQRQQRRNEALQLISSGVLDDRDAAAELRERLKRELSAKQLAS